MSGQKGYMLEQAAFIRERKDAKEQLFRKLHASGLSDPDLGNRMGIKLHTIVGMRKRFGLPANRRDQW